LFVQHDTGFLTPEDSMKGKFGPFSILGGFGTVATLCIAASLCYQMDVASVVLFVMVGWFCYGKFVFAMSFTQGYGMKGMKTVAGMPAFLAAFFLAVGGLIALMLKITYLPTGLLPGTIANLRVFDWSAASGVATAVCHWYSYGRRAYFYESEYSIRVQCAARGDSLEATQKTVDSLREHGIVR
jgi:hypothetical protein